MTTLAYSVGPWRGKTYLCLTQIQGNAPWQEWDWWRPDEDCVWRWSFLTLGKEVRDRKAARFRCTRWGCQQTAKAMEVLVLEPCELYVQFEIPSLMLHCLTLFCGVMRVGREAVGRVKRPTHVHTLLLRSVLASSLAPQRCQCWCPSAYTDPWGKHLIVWQKQGKLLFPKYFSETGHHSAGGAWAGGGRIKCELIYTWKNTNYYRPHIILPPSKYEKCHLPI